MQFREAAKLFKNSVELAKRAQARWQAEHGLDESARGMLKDIETFEHYTRIALKENPKKRILFNPPYNTLIKTGRRFAWLELEQLLGKQNFEFFLAETKKATEKVKEIEKRMDPIKRMQN